MGKRRPDRKRRGDMKRTVALCSAILAMVILAGTIPQAAAEYPGRAITIINPQSPGGAHDATGRAFAAVAEKYLGKPMMVVNKPGASTMIGTIAAAQAPADGYTLLLGSSITTTVVEWEILNGRQPGATRHDFVSIGSLTQMPTVLSVPADSPWKSIADMVKDAKVKPGFYAFCSSGILTPAHIGSEVFARTYGLNFRHVPYAPTRGAAPASRPWLASTSISRPSSPSRPSRWPRATSSGSLPSRAIGG